MVRCSGSLETAERRGGPLGKAAPAVLAMIAVSALTGLAACGSAAVGGAGHLASPGAGHSGGPAAAVRASAGVPLCAASHSVDQVVVSPASGHLHEILPRAITISDAARVRALAAALCALPPTPAGLHCSADVGGAFRLVFAAGRHGYPPVRIQDSGCRNVIGVGLARWSRSPQFARLLSRALSGEPQLIPGRQPSSVPTP
jgi:hypothetical protein